jgi:2-keto-4-pentenoate hydratase/2-oxohepta-3-ene-1,7-dioic acid hydratase in catechol pathway
VLQPRGVTLHYEVELACIVGREVRNMNTDDEEEALDAVDGNFCLQLHGSIIAKVGKRLLFEH